MANRSKLIKIDLAHNELQSLQAGIGKFSSLRILFLSFNKINNLPTSFGDLLSLEWFLCPCNQLTELPPSFHQLENLNTINLVENQFKEFPLPLKSLKNLRSLSLGDNMITHIPNWISEMQSLHDMSITNSKINSIPEEIFYLKNLDYILISPKWLHPFFRQLTTDYMDEDFAMVKPNLQENQYMTRWKNFIPNICKKMKTGESLDEWEQSYPYYTKYEHVLLPICAEFPTETSKLIETLVKKQTGLKMNKKKKILL
jgi:hypothetical protein